jgi:hypothetical protein
VQGASFREIAAELKIPLGIAHSDVQLAIAEVGPQPEQVEHARQVLNERIDRAYLKLNRAAAPMLKLVDDSNVGAARAIATIAKAQAALIIASAKLNGVNVEVAKHLHVTKDERSTLTVLVATMPDDKRQELLARGRERDRKLALLEAHVVVPKQ